MPLLECVNLVKDYPGKRAVNGVSFDIEAGEIVGLLGPNGAGKSTTFRMACGMISPTEGKVFFNGIDVTRWPMYKRARHGLGYLPQDQSIFVKLTVEQNIFAILEFMKMSSRERKERTTDLLGQFGLTDKRKQVSSTLSGGEKRRLEIARCLASEPKLILLDEPFTGIDPVTINSIQDIVAELVESGISILLTDHRERETLTITDRSNIICAGQVIVSGDAETVLNNQRAQELYFGTRFDASSIIEQKDNFVSNSRMAIKIEDRWKEAPVEALSEKPAEAEPKAATEKKTHPVEVNADEPPAADLSLKVAPKKPLVEIEGEEEKRAA